MRPTIAILPCGSRLHLQHGPIDLIIGADGNRGAAFQAAEARFTTILQELVEELPVLKIQLSTDTPYPKGAVARRMYTAAIPHSKTFVTAMAAVAGAVAHEILAAMIGVANPHRAYVNNGGDIALHLSGDERFTLAMATPDGQALGRIRINAGDGIKGIATSGLGGRSHSFGIADSVTVLARNAASADVAATLIANAVDLPDHPAIHRRPANQVRDDSDLVDRPVTVHCGTLTELETATALDNGTKIATHMANAGLIDSAALFLRDQTRIAGIGQHFTQSSDRILQIA